MPTTTHLENYSNLVDTFLEFFTVAIHLILYERDIYPHRSFLKARKYNYPVRQNRHPAVCKFIDDAVSAIRVQVMKCTVSSISIILLSPDQMPLERYVFSITSFPIVGAKEHFIPFVLAAPPTKEQQPTTNPNPATEEPPLDSTTPQVHLPSSYTHISDLHTQYTAVLERLGTCSSSLRPLPKDSTFTLAIELRQTPRGEPPVGWPMPFVPAEPGLQRGDDYAVWTVARPDAAVGESEPGTTQETSFGLWSSSDDKESMKDKAKTDAKESGDGRKQEQKGEGRERVLGKHLGGTRAVPIRNVEAGPFVMEIWVEENDAGDGEEIGNGYKSASVEDE